MKKWLLVGLLILFPLTLLSQSLPDAPSNVLDKKFLAVHAAFALTAAADAYTTVDVLGNCPRCIEVGNVLLGERPSKGRVAATLGAEFAGVTLLDYYLKKKYPAELAWAVFPAVFITGHTVGFSVNLANLRDLRRR